VSIDIYHRARHDLAISSVVVDAFGGETWAGLIHSLRLDRSSFPQLTDDIIALCIRIRIRSVGDLKCKASYGQAGVPSASSNPENAFIIIDYLKPMSWPRPKG
jgi:hypothetical protein